jgi:hypothetical protein
VKERDTPPADGKVGFGMGMGIGISSGGERAADRCCCDVEDDVIRKLSCLRGMLDDGTLLALQAVASRGLMP